MAANYNASYDFGTSPNLTLCPQDGNTAIAVSGGVGGGGGSGGGTSINCTDDDDLQPRAADLAEDDIWTPDVIQRVASLAFIMTLTLVGNTVIISVLTCSRYRKRSSRVNIFIINLAVGDLAVCVCTMTTEILFVAFGQWVLGPAACKILTYLQIVTLASTTFILSAMSFDRYLAICKPLKYRATTSRAKKFIALSWTLAFIFALPQLFIFVQTVDVKADGTAKYGCKTQGYTEPWQRKVYFTFMTLYILVLPVALITFCYTSIVLVVSRVGRDVQQSNSFNNCGLRRSVVDNSTFPRAKIKTLKMTFTIIATFVICWTPYFVTTLIRIYSDYTVDIPASVMAFAETIALLQSGLNPLLYGCFNVKIKRGLADVFCRYRLKGPRWAMSYNKSGGLTECYSMTEDAVNNANGLHGGTSARLRESASNNSNSSGSAADSKSRVITEENKNGVRLRVRFAPKDSPASKFADKALSNEALETGDGEPMFPKHSCLKHPAAGYYQ